MEYYQKRIRYIKNKMMSVSSFKEFLNSILTLVPAIDMVFLMLIVGSENRTGMIHDFTHSLDVQAGVVIISGFLYLVFLGILYSVEHNENNVWLSVDDVISIEADISILCSDMENALRDKDKKKYDRSKRKILNMMKDLELIVPSYIQPNVIDNY